MLNKNYEGLAYTVIIDKFYLPILDKLIQTHQKFSKIDLYVFTVNFEVTDRKYSNIKFIKCTDKTLQDFNKGDRTIIKNDREKHKYSTTLKPKFLSSFIEDIKYYFFVDCDVLFTEFSDTLFFNSIQKFGDTEMPVSTKFFHQYCNHGNTERIINEDGTVNINSLTYKPLCDLNKEEPRVIDYVSTYCMYYTNKCGKFFSEVDEICTSIFKNGLDYDLYLPLGDETVFNYLYSKNNFTNSLSSFICYNISPFLDIQTVLQNISSLNRESLVAFIHTKRFLKAKNHEQFKSLEEIKLNDEEYKEIYRTLNSEIVYQPKDKISITKIHKNYNTNLIKINFSFNKTLGPIKIKLINSKSQKERRFDLNIKKDLNYFFQISMEDFDWGDEYIWGVVYGRSTLTINTDELIQDVFKIT